MNFIKCLVLDIRDYQLSWVPFGDMCDISNQGEFGANSFQVYFNGLCKGARRKKLISGFQYDYISFWHTLKIKKVMEWWEKIKLKYNEIMTENGKYWVSSSPVVLDLNSQENNTSAKIHMIWLLRSYFNSDMNNTFFSIEKVFYLWTL